jgi:hypothetical protein
MVKSNAFTGGAVAGLTSTENIIMASGKGIDFSASGSAAGATSEVLSDYERGTFTPTLTTAGVPATGLAVALGRYVKVGDTVTIWANVSVDGGTTVATGNYVGIANFPFTPSATALMANPGSIEFNGTTGLAAGDFLGVTIYSTPNVNLKKLNKDGIIGGVGLTYSDLSATFSTSITITYQTA